MHREWIEPALERHLDRVAAPEELWERVRNPQVVVAKRKGVHRSVNSARLGACVTVVLLAILLYPWHRGVRSGDAGEIRAWVKDKAGIDVPLREHAAGVRLTGASVRKGSVEIAYRVGKRDGRLVVGGRPSASSARVFTWSMDGRTYTLECATPEDLKMACNLCHIG
jgi:hypothetical protein